MHLKVDTRRVPTSSLWDARWGSQSRPRLCPSRGFATNNQLRCIVSYMFPRLPPRRRCERCDSVPWLCGGRPSISNHDVDPVGGNTPERTLWISDSDRASSTPLCMPPEYTDFPELTSIAHYSSRPRAVGVFLTRVQDDTKGDTKCDSGKRTRRVTRFRGSTVYPTHSHSDDIFKHIQGKTMRRPVFSWRNLAGTMRPSETRLNNRYDRLVGKMQGPGVAIIRTGPAAGNLSLAIGSNLALGQRVAVSRS